MTANPKAVAHFQNYQSRKSVLPDFRSSGLLAKWPIIGLTMFIFGSLMFGALTFNLLAQGPLLVWDRALANMLPAIILKSSTLIQYFMNIGFYIGNEVIIVLVILHALYFWYKRYWQELAMLTIGTVGGGLLFQFLSRLIARPRPPTQMGIIIHGNLSGFPSGHAIAVITFYGLLAYLLTPKMRSVFWKVIVIATALLIIGFVGFSRIVTGGHYLTDVLAGYAVGIAWSGMAYTLIEIYFQKRKS
jgi:membrane-associated phospholipid phosphatase